MLKLLIVDDERLDREGLRRQIDWESLGITRIDTARNGYEAMEILREQKPDILVADVKMPGMTGIELASRAYEHVPWLKIIFVSGYDDFKFVKGALHVKACEYILKPVDSSELLNASKKAAEERLRELGMADAASDVRQIDDIRRQGCRRIVKNVIKYIEENYSRDISLKDIASLLYYSPNHLGALFKKEMNQGFSEYLAVYRIKKAAELLKKSDLKTYEAAEMVGYKNISSFISRFRTVFNLTPKEYKEKC